MEYFDSWDFIYQKILRISKEKTIFYGIWKFLSNDFFKFANSSEEKN
jgi:hypothetical protein